MKPGRLTLTILLLLIGLVLVNYLASALPVRIDATAEKIYTLSSGTEELITEIEDPITLDFYFSRSVSGVPISYKNYADRVEEILRQYVRLAGGRVTLNVIDPRVDTPEEEQAIAAGLAMQTVPSGEPVYLGLVATQADEQEIINNLSPQRESFLEYDVSELIFRVQQLERPRLGILSSLPIQDTSNPALLMSGQATPGQYVSTAWSNSYELVEIFPNAAELPDDLDVLAVIHPQTLRPTLEYEIDQFVLSGKPLFLAIDPSSWYERNQNPQMAQIGSAPATLASDLASLLETYGIDYDTDHVVGDPLHPRSVYGGNGAIYDMPVWLNLSEENFSADSQPLSQLQLLLFPEAGALGPIPGSTSTFTPMIQTSDQSGTLDPEVLINGSPEEISLALDHSGKQTIAALVTGHFNSAFPGGRPDSGTGEDEPVVTEPSLRESVAESSVFVVADTDWLLDGFSVERSSFLGQQTIQPINNNLAFAVNVMDYLGGSSELINIRGKGSAVRPFAVVQDLEVAANQRYQQRLESVNDRLQQIQDRLSQLISQNDDALGLVTPPAVADAIAEAQQEQAALQAERREIRRALREDIEALENRLLFFNLAASPILLCLFGLWFHRRRRRR